MKALSWFLARRYLASRKKGRLLSFITWIALGGITVGVTALIVVLAVMNGAQEELYDKILGSTPHVIVLERGPSLRMNGWQEVAERVRAIPRVEAVAPFALSNVIVARGDEYVQAADLYGVALDTDQEQAVTRMEADISRGILDLGPTRSGAPPLVAGARLAERMALFPGDSVLVYSLEHLGTNPMGYPQLRMREFEVTGTFETGMYDYDIGNLYGSLEWVQSLLGMGADEVSGLGVRIEDPWAASEVAREMQEALGFPYFAESWITTNQTLFSALELEKLAMAVILFLIVIVAAFNIVSTLVMVVVDRTSEIGILKSMGMTDGQVLKVFLLQGMAIGVLGTMLGSGIGLFLTWILLRFEIIEIPPDVYFIERLPVSVNPVDVLVIVGGSFLISLLATIYPALQASRLLPVEAIRRE